MSYTPLLDPGIMNTTDFGWSMPYTVSFSTVSNTASETPRIAGNMEFVYFDEIVKYPHKPKKSKSFLDIE